MFQALRERRQDDRGFTLIELMIVILIIGILIAVGLPTFLGARERAQDRAAQALLRNGMVAAKTWYTDANTYTGLGITQAAAIEPSITWVSSAPTAAGPVYLPTVTSSTVILATLSGSGAWFCLKDVSGSSTASENGTWYARGSTSSCGTYSTVSTTGWAPPSA